MNNLLVRYILGYTIGIIVFCLLIPIGLYELSRIDHLLFKPGFNNYLLSRVLISLPVLIIGLIFLTWSNIYLVKIGKGGPLEGLNVSISPRTKKLVITGPYRYTRNPMVFGAFSVYLAIAVFMHSIICLLCLLIFFFIATAYLKFSEEKRLIKDFGQEYIEYKKRVSMILPIKKLKKRQSEN